MPLAAWEVISARRLPLLTAISSLASDLLHATPRAHFESVAVNAISVGGMLLAWYLSRAAFGSAPVRTADARRTGARVSPV